MAASAEHDPASPEVLDDLVRASFTVMALLSQAAAEHDLSLTSYGPWPSCGTAIRRWRSSPRTSGSTGRRSVG